MSATMKDVAKHADLSLGTVSNYINGKGNISDINKNKIEEAITALGYQVNEVARSLKTNSFRTIGFLIPTFANAFLVKLIWNIEEYLREQNYSLLVVSYNGDEKKEGELLTYLSARVDGIIYGLSMIENNNAEFFKNIQKRVPVVTVNEKFNKIICDSVITDSKEMVRLATAALIEKGHKKISLVAGPEGFFTTTERLNGFKTAYEQQGLTPPKELIIFSNYSRSTATVLCDELLCKHDDITAFFVVGYKMTLGVLSCLEKRGLRNKVSVIGFDAEDIEHIMTPSLPYVDQPFEQMAIETAKLILKRANGDYSNFPVSISLQGELKNLDTILSI